MSDTPDLSVSRLSGSRPFGSPESGSLESSSLEIVAQCVLVVLLSALPGVLLADVVADSASMLVGAFASLVGAGVLFVIGPLLRSKFRVATAWLFAGGSSLLVALSCSIVVAFRWPSVRSRPAVAAVCDALLYGWSALATSPVPAFAEPRTLTPITIVCCVSAAVGVALVRSSRGVLLPLLTPSLAFLLGAVAGGKQQFGAIGCALTFVALASGLVWLRSSARARGERSGVAANSKRHSRTRFELALLCALCGTSLIGGAVFGPRAAFGRDKRPYDLRDHLVPPSVPNDAINPLELVASRRQSEGQLMATLRTTVPLVSQDLRLVALNHFDGATWTTNAPYERAGAILEPAIARTSPMVSIRADVALVEPDGPWLLSIGDPVSITGMSVLTDPTSGSLVATQTPKPGQSYRLVTSRAQPDVAALISTPVGSSEQARQGLDVPNGIPQALVDLARTAIGDRERPFERAVALRSFLRTNFAVAPNSTGGFSYGHLETAFVKNAQATEEQFGAAFATLGRVVGLPTRLVVGFSPKPANTDGVVEVFANDARVWPEVLFEDVGWLPFDATPPRDGSGSNAIGFGGGQPVELQSTPPPSLPEPPPVSPTDNRPIEVSTPTPFWVRVAQFGALALVTLAILSVLIVVKKRKLTARRRRGTARESVIGAWNDVVDRMRESGMVNTANKTVDELVQATEQTNASLAGLYRPVNLALYGQADLDETDRELAWKARDRFVESLKRVTPAHRRLWRALDPRPLLSAHSARHPSTQNASEQ